MKRRLVIAVGVLLLGARLVPGFATQALVRAAEPAAAAQLLPDSTVIYAEIADPKAALATLLNHPLRQRIEALDAVEQAKKQDQYQQFQAVLAVVEAQMGLKWHEAVEQVASGGFYLAVDGATEGVALIMHGDEEVTDKVLNTLIRLTREDAQRKGNDDPIKQAEYRGITAYRAGEARLARSGSWLLASNKDDLAKQLADAILDGRSNPLANKDSFQQARAARQGQPTGWMYLDINALREANVADELYAERTDNPGAELIFGGISSNLAKTPYATVSLYISAESTRLVLAAPHDASWVSEARSHFFGPDGKGSAPPAPQVPNALFSLTTYRDISHMWLYAGDLFDENINDELAQADSNLSTLFSGKNFGEDVLGAITPQIQFVASRQDFGDRVPQPTIKLPSFAAVFELKDPEKTRDEFRRTFQSLIGFLNVVGAMNGQPQLDMETTNNGDITLVTASFVPEPKERESKAARINYNFTPSVAFVGPRLILSSTRELAEQLSSSSSAVGQDSAYNTQLELHADVLAEVLNDNRESLIAQNMFENGHGREEAVAQIDILFEVIRAFRGASMSLSTQDGQLQLETTVLTK